MAIIIFMLSLALLVMLVSGRLLRLATTEAPRTEQVYTLAFIGAFVGFGVVLNVSAPNYQLGLLLAGAGVGFSTTMLFSMTRGVWSMLLEPFILMLLLGLGLVFGRGAGLDPITLIEGRLTHLGHPITSTSVGYLSSGTALGIVAGVTIRSIAKLVIPGLKARAKKPAMAHRTTGKSTKSAARSMIKSKSQKALETRMRGLT
ncbi:MAG: hypothetical protein AAF216_08450 [Pseudomonadota bacterium]